MKDTVEQKRRNATPPKEKRKKKYIYIYIYHESWNFPAGVSFALKQTMYWGGFCAFLPDISGRGGGHSLEESANLRGEGGVVVSIPP